MLNLPPFRNGEVPESGQTGPIVNRVAIAPSWVQIPPSGFKKLPCFFNSFFLSKFFIYIVLIV